MSTRFLIGALAVVASLPISSTPAASGENSAAAGSRTEVSDPRALEIADQVMQAMGGREAYDRTRYLRWNFFGRRTHLWDKWTGDLRTEFVGEDGDRVVILTNLNDGGGQVYVAGVAQTGEELAAWLDRGRSMWINDSYWLIMPYKLEDPGVRLQYGGPATMEDGRPADRLVLTFEDVGDTPENKYDVYVARDSHLVEEWAYYPNAADDEPRFRMPWREWKPYGNILLSGDRGEYRITDIAVFDEVDRKLFEEP